MATVTIRDEPVTEPDGDQEVLAGTLTLTTSSGGTLETEVVVAVTATDCGTASK